MRSTLAQKICRILIGMRRRNSQKKLHRSMLALLLLVFAGGGGYVAMSYFHERPPVAHDDTTTVQPEQPGPQPDPLACVKKIPTITKLHQKIMVAAYNDQIDQLITTLQGLPIGGIIIMNETSGEQIAKLQTAFSITPIIAVDQEGGTVQRYKGQGPLAGASDMAKLPPEQAYAAYLQDSQYLAGLGITVNFAPVVDVESKAISPLPGRLFSSDPSIVTTYAEQAIRAMKDAGIQPVIKHFPGLGSASGNTDLTSASTDPFSMLENRDVLPYKDLVSLKPDVMVGNMIVPELTDGQPAIWSSEAIALLRSLGYKDAVVYTDSLTAQAIPGTLEAATLKVWVADADIAVVVQDREQTANLASYITLITDTAARGLQSGEFTEDQLDQSVARILTHKNISPCDVSQ